MNHLDILRQIQRMHDAYKPIQAYLQYDNMQRAVDSYRMQISANELAKRLKSIQGSLPDYQSLMFTSQALENAARRFADINMFHHIKEINKYRSAFSALNAAIDKANLIAELDITIDEKETEDKDNVAEVAEQQLIQIASEDTLNELRRVDFAPITLLDQALRDPDILHTLSSRDFEGFVAALIENLGFEDVVLTQQSGDQGRDVLAKKQIHGMSILFAFECKRYAPDRPVGPDIARALLGVISHNHTRATKGVLVTTSRFTPSASKFILTEPQLDGRDFNGIVDWLHEAMKDKP